MHSSEDWKYEIREPAWPGPGEGLLSGCRPLTLPCILQGGKMKKEQSGVPLIRTLIPFISFIPFMRVPLSLPNYFQKSPLPET